MLHHRQRHHRSASSPSSFSPPSTSQPGAPCTVNVLPLRSVPLRFLLGLLSLPPLPWRNTASFVIEVSCTPSGAVPFSATPTPEPLAYLLLHQWHPTDASFALVPPPRAATGIAPFLPVTTPLSAASTLTHGLLFLFRLPLFLTYVAIYFLLLHHLPLPVVVRKIALWGLMAIPGIWWIDLQLDGVKRGTLAEQPRKRFPHPHSVIAANHSSPIDAIYLAAVFDPIFTISYPDSRKLQRVGLLGAVLHALGPVKTVPPPGAKLVDIQDLIEAHPDRLIAVFPECTTTNGKAILPLAPSLAQCASDVLIFPVGIRYTPSDVTTPLPGRWLSFLWNLLCRPTTCIRVRIAEGQLNTAAAAANGAAATNGAGQARHRKDAASQISSDEKRLLDRIAEALARLTKVKRVGLTAQDKTAFVNALTG